MLYRMRQRRGTAAEWADKNPVLGDGEFGVARDTKAIKLGDGMHAWNDLPVILSGFYLPAVTGPVNADTLDNRDSTEFALNTDFDSRTLQVSPTRKLVTHWGSGTSFPVVGILPGDTFARSDVGNTGSTWIYVGGLSGKNGWVHKGPIIATSLTRPQTTDTNPVLYDGLQLYETDTKVLRYYNGTAFVANLLPRAQVRATVASTSYSANVWQTISFGIADFDTHVMWASGSPSRLTCKQAGDYLVSGHVQLSAFVSVSSRIIKNGATFPNSTGLYGNSMVNSEVGPRLLTLAVNDYVELQANVGTAGWAAAVAADATSFFTAIRIS